MLFLVAIDGALVQGDDVVDERLGFEHLDPFCPLQELALEVGSGLQPQFEIAVFICGPDLALRMMQRQIA